MKNKILVYIASIGLLASSCNKFLNVNTNPNNSTATTPDKILPQAIVNTASLVSSLNIFGGWIVGYESDVSGTGGYGANWSYEYSTSAGNGFWTSGYYIIQNLQSSIVNYAVANPEYANYAAVAKILNVYNFELLVDNFNNIPFSQALQGANNLTPAYDSAAVIYPKLALMLDTAINEINNSADASPITPSSDPMFGGDLDLWKQFANTLKLRLIVRGTSNSSGATFPDNTFTSDGFLTTDAVVNPGYNNSASASGVQTNPTWSYYVVSYTGSTATRSVMACMYSLGYYTGNKLSDPARGAAVYYNFQGSSAAQLGTQLGATATVAPNGATGSWYSGNAASVGSGGTSLGNNIGVMKGPNMGQPIILAAEAYFLKAEAENRGILPGGDAAAATDFNAGIEASFNYLYELPNGTLAAGYDPEADAQDYIDSYAGNPLVDYSAAETAGQQIEAIITQKYIALNMINGFEAWNEYRRTGYPVSSGATVNNPYGAMASTQSLSTRPDKLPTRIPYPATEYSTNAANIPAGINVFSSLIFWAK